jgi:2-oxoglutarate ferredoxin oxidoreductase subunit beta
MLQNMTDLRHKYLRHHKKFPHVWCPGCGIGIVLGSLIRAIEKLSLEKDEIVLASGIGCSGRMPTYVDFNTLHTTHGRALTFASGVKLAKPSLNVITVMGDGDATAIGGTMEPTQPLPPLPILNMPFPLPNSLLPPAPVL